MMNQSRSLLRARDEHDRWLLKNNCHPSQLKKRKKKSNKPKDFGVAKEYYSDQSNTIPPSAPIKSIWEDIRSGNESPQTIAAIKEKASRTAPAFNKGGMQLLSKDQIIYSGKK
jgi:hypothetical protein